MQRIRVAKPPAWMLSNVPPLRNAFRHGSDMPSTYLDPEQNCEFPGQTEENHISNLEIVSYQRLYMPAVLDTPQFAKLRCPTLRQHGNLNCLWNVALAQLQARRVLALVHR